MIKRKTSIKDYPKKGGPVSQVERATPVVVEAVRLGVPVSKACTKLGLTSQAFSLWKRRYAEMEAEMERMSHGKRSNYLKSLSKHNRDILTLFQQIKKAEAEHIQECVSLIREVAEGGTERKENKEVYETKVLKDGTRVKYLKEHTIVTKADKPNWTAAAWLLERLYPEYYGRNRTPDDDTASQLADNIHSAIQVVIGEE